MKENLEEIAGMLSKNDLHSSNLINQYLNQLRTKEDLIWRLYERLEEVFDAQKLIQASLKIIEGK